MVFSFSVFSGDLAQLIGKKGLIAFAVVAGCVVVVLLVAVVYLYCRKSPRSRDAYQPAHAMQQNQFPSDGYNQHPSAGMVQNVISNLILSHRKDYNFSAGVAFSRNGGKGLYGDEDPTYVHGMTAMPNLGNVVLPVGGMGYEGHTTLFQGN